MGDRGLELALHKGCDFLGKSYCLPSLFFVGIYEIFQGYRTAAPYLPKSLGRQFQLAESLLTLHAIA